jgi:DNA-binding HxlR family transcriptional regulator
MSLRKLQPAFGEVEPSNPFHTFPEEHCGIRQPKKVLNVNSRTLSDKLKSLQEGSYIERTIDEGPPLRVKYSLTTLGRNVILLVLPLLYYSRTHQ